MKKIDLTKIKEFYKKRKILSVVIIVFIALFIAWGRSVILTSSKEGRFLFFGKAKPKEEVLQPAIPVNVVKIQLIDFKDVLPAIGTVKGATEIDLKFQENGYIDSFKFKEGDAVKKGDVLASLNQREKRIKLDYSKLEFEKNEKLFELGGIAKPKYEQSKLEFESAQNEFDKTSIFAPTEGLMGPRLLDEGSFVTSNDKVGAFVDISSLRCDVGIIEKDADKIKREQKAFISVDVYPDKIFEGIVDSVSPMLEGRSRTQTVKIKLENPGNLIKPGMFARANIVIFEKANSIVVPTSALKKSENDFVVFVVERAKSEEKKPKENKESPEADTLQFGVAKERKITVGRISQDLALIDDGLKSDEEIIVETPESKEKLKDGTRVEILPGE